MSEYIDGMLGEREASALKKHLDECAGCSEVYRSTTVIIEHMQQMESIEEPVDFLEKVNTRLDKRFSLGGILRRLFKPMRIKIPLEAAAAAVVIAVIVYLGGVKEPQPQYQITITESDDRLLLDDESGISEEIALPRGAVKTGEFEKLESDAKVFGSTVTRESAPEEIASEKPVTDTPKSKRVDHLGFAPAGSESKETADTPKPKESDTRESAPADGEPVRPVTDTPKPKEADTKESPPAESDLEESKIVPPKPAASGKRIEKSDITTFRAKKGPKGEAPLKETIKSLGGKVIEAEYLEGTEKPKRMIIEIPAGNFERLIQELIRRGEIKAPPTEIKRKANDLIRVELIFQRSNPPQ
jgi:hypothetical protein